MIVKIHKGKALILLALIVIVLSGWALAHQSKPFASCTQAKAAGRSNIPKSDPKYNPALDRNKNDFACE